MIMVGKKRNCTYLTGTTCKTKGCENLHAVCIPPHIVGAKQSSS